MIDFLRIATRSVKKDVIEVYPKFAIGKSDDLMIRGGDFYAIWVEERGLWSTDEQDVIRIIDRELDIYAKEKCSAFDADIKVQHMWDSDSGAIDRWHKYCQKQMRDSFHALDEKLIFANTPTDKRDYASKKLPYPLESGSIDAYERLISTLYSPEERHKIEWAVGAVVSGDSKKLQKFLVLYGEAGTGKSTILNIIAQLFDGYYAVFDAKALGSSSNSFALEAFRSSPLVAIQHDGDLSKIEDNTRLNSLVSHETMMVNEKFKSQYASSFKSFLFMGTNKPVKITDARSGLIRRLIDVAPTGQKLPQEEYKALIKKVDFELGAIASHCRDVYLSNKSAYDDYVPTAMLGASNDFYNFIIDSYHVFKKEDGTTLKASWEMYKTYCDDAKVGYPFSQRVFKEELKSYFREYKERFNMDDGTRVRSYYIGFKSERFEKSDSDISPPALSVDIPAWLELNVQHSLLDDILADSPAQYAVRDEKTGIEKPLKAWDNATTKLCDLDTSRLHYILPNDKSHIFLDLDIKDADGNKSRALNLEAAKQFPPTYAELSKGGEGLHLHYIYTGDIEKLKAEYADNIEIKVFVGKSTLRRRLSECNDIPIATISSGLPLKEKEKNVINKDIAQTEKGLRTTIEKCLAKEVHPDTSSNVNFIYDILEKAYDGGLVYDVSDMRGKIFTFAAGSSNQSERCIQLVGKMKFKSDEDGENDISESVSDGISDIEAHDACVQAPIVFFDVEIFPNLFVVCWKKLGEDNTVVKWINPSPAQIEELLGTSARLVGFNCRKYDNHMLYASLMGYDTERLYELSGKIIGGDKNVFFREAYGISYTDIYDFCSKKQSLKKWEIELGIHHKELGLPWDKPVPEEKWGEVAEYCGYDVIATEAVWNARQADFTARKILADVAGLTVNDTTNTLTTRIIFGSERNPQGKFNYRFMGDIPDDAVSYSVVTEQGSVGDGMIFESKVAEGDYTVFDKQGRPVFPGYTFEKNVSVYRGEEIGEGGYVYSEPGMYSNVALLDIASMHPSSVVAENLFGDEYTSRFKEILNARIAVKHKDFDKARSMLGGALAKYLTDESASDLAQALKIAINSVYGLTSAKFQNPFNDIRNTDNIVAKRGALFMVNLRHEVQKRGYTVAHIKTDSIKIPNADGEIIKFVTEYGKLYGYSFEHEATYDRMCLVNDAVYIAKYVTEDIWKKLYGDSEAPKDIKKHGGEWTATGTQFAVPYVFKKIFTGEAVGLDDLCETKSVDTAIYLKKDESLRFIGKVGSFCPMTEGYGGTLLRQGIDKNGDIKYDAVSGTKGYLWEEAEVVRGLLEYEKFIDISYYEAMAEKARAAISKYGDLTWFVESDGNAGDICGDDEKTPPWECAGEPYEEPECTPFDVR